MIPNQYRQITAILFFAILLVGPGYLFAQKPDKLSKKANVYYARAQYSEAEELYKRILEANPDDFRVAYRLGLINTELRDYREALKYYRKTSENRSNRNDTVYFRIGTTYKVLNNYRKAKESFNEFLRRHKKKDDFTERAELEIKGCDLAEASIGQRPPFRVNEASINSSAWDFYPAMLDQRQEDKFLVFASFRAKGKKKKKKASRVDQPSDSDFYMVVMEDDSTFGAEVTNLGKPINTKYNDGGVSYTGDGLTMFYSISNASKRGYGTSIYESKYDPIKKRWSKPKPVKGINGTREVVINTRGKTRMVAAYDAHPYVTRDGRTMFFVSDRDGGEGGLDIWFSRKVGLGWSQPANAGETLNTPFNEYTPFLSETGNKLFFGSNGHAGFGGADLFVSEGEIGNWRDPVNMGSPINTSYDDFGSIWMDNDSSVIFTSNRPGGTGSYDIYWGRFIHYPVIIPEISLHGLIRDKDTKQPISFATAILYEKTGGQLIVIDTFETDQSARYNFDLEPDKTYKVLGNAPEYFANEIEVTTPPVDAGNTDLERNIDIELKVIDPGEIITLENVYYDFDEYYLREDAVLELSNLLKILRDNPNITVVLGSHTDTNGPPQYNQTLSENRAKAVIRYLVDNNIDPARLWWVGHGEKKPLVYPEMNDEDEQVNRRTEFRVKSILFGE